nr:MAG TPA: hypothetical protein [Caudoviricetes sp.]
MDNFYSLLGKIQNFCDYHKKFNFFLDFLLIKNYYRYKKLLVPKFSY